MAKPTLTRSAALHLRMGAFAGLFAIFLACFPPAAAFALAIAVSVFLAKL
ncbi:hypothetical protein C8R31_10479 [Nitrosospira sp. Nsp2]|nr:hypothetical protein [Nitrosospira sp. Nsp2]PTR15053.1 hypothetical protein C8R31_10479 [Nitrosospira sp. Nsp2]